MIRSLMLLQVENKKLFKQVYKRLVEHPASGGFCRFTFEEVKDIAQQANQRLGANESQYFEWKGQFSIEEWNLVSSVLSQSEDRHDAIKKKCRVANERTTRYLRDLFEVHKKEQELEQQYLELQSARSSVGQANGTVADALDRRFQNFEDGRGSVRVEK